MRQKAYALILSAMIALSVFTFLMSNLVKADEGCAKVYILQLPGIGGWSYGGSYNISKVTEGAIHALHPSMQEDNSPHEMLWVHPKYGQFPPFYSIDYEVVTTWSQYEDIIVSQKEVIIVNTHGQAIPIPSGYSKEDWTDGIAWAMYTKRLTWVHTTGYPFYLAVYENGSMEDWGVGGFKRLMSHINRGDAVCSNPIPPGPKAPRTGEAYSQLGNGYRDMPSSVDIGMPLNGSYFEDYIALSLYQYSYMEIPYCSGAIIVFAKPSKRFNPTSPYDNPYGFGVYVHMGTHSTYSGSGNSDFDRGYTGVAAAVWAEMNAFCPVSEKVGAFGEYPNCEYALFTRPTISSLGQFPGLWEVRISFPLYGVLKHKKDTHRQIEYVRMWAERIPADCSIEMRTCLSKEGRSGSPGIALYGVSTGPGVPPIAQSLMYGASLATLLIEGLPPIGWLLAPIGGIMLFQNWALHLNPWGGYPGVNNPNSYVDFSYTPIENTTDNEEGGIIYTYHEFESIITLVLHIPRNNESNWRVIPLQWTLIMVLQSAYGSVSISGGISVAIFLDGGNNPTVFFEDFQDGMNDWSVCDDNPSEGYDYWGLFNFSGTSSDSVWCAWVGDNSIYSEPNKDCGFYDRCMKAHLTHSIDVRPFLWAELSFQIMNFVQSGSYLNVSYYDTGWHVIESFTTVNGWQFKGPYTLPNTATAIRFTFVSSDSSAIYLGCWLDNIAIKGILSNDAETGGDGGNSFAQATFINVPTNSLKNYAGYLEDEDWFKFTISSSDLSKKISVNLYPPQETDFDIELYNPNNQKKQGPLDSIDYRFTPSDITEDWRIRIFPVSGFGQYDFSIGLIVPQGGCPYVYVWNGHRYVIDNNLLPASELNPGIDIDDYYKFEQPLVPLYAGTSYSLYTIRISEFENEHSYIDQIKLFAVDHESNINVAVSPNGEILTYGNPLKPITCNDKYGHNMLEAVKAIDDSYYQGYADDYLTLDFGNPNIQNGSKLVMRADEKEWYSINIQILNSTQEWTTVTTVHPRALWATEIVDLSAYLPDSNENLMIRLYFTAKHKLDYVGLDTSPQADITIHTSCLLFAYHSEYGLVRNELNLNDQVYAELLPGQQIQLIFKISKETSEARTFIVYTRGRYYTI